MVKTTVIYPFRFIHHIMDFKHSVVHTILSASQILLDSEMRNRQKRMTPPHNESLAGTFSVTSDNSTDFNKTEITQNHQKLLTPSHNDSLAGPFSSKSDNSSYSTDFNQTEITQNRQKQLSPSHNDSLAGPFSSKSDNSTDFNQTEIAQNRQKQLTPSHNESLAGSLSATSHNSTHSNKNEIAQNRKNRQKRFVPLVPPFIQGIARLFSPNDNTFRPNFPYAFSNLQTSPGILANGAVQSYSGFDPRAIRYQNGGRGLVQPTQSPLIGGLGGGFYSGNGRKTVPGLARK